MKINLIGKSFDKSSGQGIYRYSAELFDSLKEKGFDVVKNDKGDINHVMQPELIWRTLFKKNVVVTVHDVIPLVYGERKLLYRLFFYFCCLLTSLKARKIICVSNCTKKDFLSSYSWAGKKTRVIYEGVDQKEFYPDKLRGKNRIEVIGYIGGLGKRKNIEFLLLLAKELPKIKFKIAGKGREKERLETLSKELNLKNVEFIGFVENKKMKEFYNSLDLFIFPSLYEGFGLPVLEAMACGTPVLVSNKGSLPEIVRRKSSVIYINNLEDVIKKIEKLKKENKTLKKFSQESIKGSKFFSLDNTIKHTVKFYSER